MYTVSDSEQKLDFKRIFCPVTKSCCIGAISNLLSHLKKHRTKFSDIDAWLNIFESKRKAVNKVLLDEKVFKLLLFFYKFGFIDSYV